MVTRELTGGCACGAIRYQSKGGPKFAIICQCRQCQRITGGGHAASFAVDAETTEVEGDLSYYEQTSDSGSTTRSGFCGNCGNPVLKTTSGHAEFTFFHAATLDDPAIYKPEMVVYSTSKQPWDHVDSALPRR